MYVLKLELVIIEFLESLETHLPPSIASLLKHLVDHWRNTVSVDMLRKIERMKKDVDSLRRELSEIQSITRKMKNSSKSDTTKN